MMKTSFRTTAVLFILACSLPLAAQGVFVVTDVHEDGVLVSPVDTGTKKIGEITKGFTRFDLFDVYSARGADSLLTDFVDSLYYDSTTQEGVLLRFVWKGESKFMKRGFFAVRTGRIYVTGDDETVSKATVRANPLSDGQIKGSFGVPGLALMTGVGAMGGTSFGSSTAQDIMYYAQAKVRLRYSFIGLTLQAAIPVVGADISRLTGTALADIYLNLLPFMTLYSSVGAGYSGTLGLAVAAGLYILLPVFGSSSLMPYVELSGSVPNVLAGGVSDLAVYAEVSIGLKL